MSKESPKFDLHCHTFHSDGLNSPKEMLEKANELKLDYLAITDHNTTDGIIDLIESGELKGSTTKVIPGIELSTLQGHYLILGIDPFTQKRQLKKWGLTKGSFAEFVTYTTLQEYLRWSMDQNAFIIVAHPCMPTILMSTQYSTLVDLQNKSLIHGAENNNHDVKRHYGILYKLYQQYVDRRLSDINISKFSNSDAHDQQYLGYYTNKADAQTKSFIDWVKQTSPFVK
jgi:histidinol phosphatase-like PHP family hydrolase